MSELLALNKAIRALDNLWPLLQGDEQEAILQQRNRLNQQADELAHKSLTAVDAELQAAIDQLIQTTENANEARAVIDRRVERIEKVAATVNSVVGVIEKLGQILARI